jgi:hypothetical protein
MSPCSPRLDRALIAAALGLIIAIGISLVTEQSSSAAINRGDFPAFYTMGHLVANGDGHRLYDLDLQRQVQNAVWPSMSGSVLPAAYPAYLGFLVQPLALLDVTTSRMVWVIFMIACVIVAAVVLARSIPTLTGMGWRLVISLFLFCPLFMGVIGGQIVGWSLLCYSLLFALNRRRSVGTEVLFGAVVGMWMVKPHYALAAVAMILFERRWVALGSWFGVSFIFWSLGTLVAGPDWVHEWVAFARHFSEIDLATNAYQMTGVIPLGYSLARGLGFGSMLSAQVWDLLSLLAALVVPVGLLIARRIDQWYPTQSVPLPLLSLGPLLVLFAPVVNFYDLGLALLPLVVLFRPTSPRDRALAGFVLIISQAVGLGRDGALSGIPFIIALGVIALWVRATARELSQSKPRHRHV